MSRLGTMLVDYGDLPSLVAMTILARPDQAVIFHPRGLDTGAAGREAAAMSHAETLDVGGFLVDGLPELDAATVATGSITDAERLEALDDACVLMRAAAAADRLGCSRIIWPRQVGPDADRIAQAVQRANLVADVVQIGSGAGAGAGGAAGGAAGSAARRVVIDLPLVDLTDERLVDLADDGGAPMRSFHPCTTGGGARTPPCEQCEGCRRWRAAFEAAGVAWPWVPVGA